jgi:hypothetical protein
MVWEKEHAQHDAEVVSVFLGSARSVAGELSREEFEFGRGVLA